eukprot:2126892-Pyramimonas_sp.AAC.1
MAYRLPRGAKKSTHAEDAIRMFPPPDAEGHDSMWAEFADGTKVEVSDVTVDMYNSAKDMVKKVKNDNMSAQKKAGAFSGTDKDGKSVQCIFRNNDRK